MLNYHAVKNLQANFTITFLRTYLMSSNFSLNILFEDEYLIAVNKPPNMFSVPAKYENFDHVSSDVVNKKRRFEQWGDAIQASVKFTSNEKAQNIIRNIVKINSVPRKENSFKGYINRKFKESDTDIINTIWDAVCSADIELNRVEIDKLPKDMISSYELIREKTKHLFQVHRLDYETSGVVLYAKSSQIAAQLNKQFKDREVDKFYIAQVVGKPTLDSISLPIGPDSDPAKKPRQMVDEANGKEALTLVKILAEVPGSISSKPLEEIFISDPQRKISFPSSIVSLKPVTGRSHQLRLHLSAMGNPILGDTLYAQEEVEKSLDRLALHAYKIIFKHPVTGTTIELEAPLDDLIDYKKYSCSS